MPSRKTIIATLAYASSAWISCAAGQSTMVQATAAVQVEYIQPEKFADLGDRYVSSDKVRAAHLEELRRHIQQRAVHFLSAGQKLEVTITEIDMAGGFEPWLRDLGRVRIVRDVYPPRIDLRFRLVNADGVTAREGERKLRDLSFLMTNKIWYRNDALRYEKTLLDDWLERELQRPSA